MSSATAAQSDRVSPPAHVPADRIVDFDVYGVDPDQGDYAMAFKTLVDQGFPQLCWSPRNGGHWIFTSADGVDFMYTQNDLFSSRSVTVPAGRTPDPPMLPVMADPPEWMGYRIFFNRALSPKSVVPLADKARALAVRLIEGLEPKGLCEFISEFALHLPIAIFMNMANLPAEDRDFLLEVVGQNLRPESPESQREAYGRLTGYALGKVRERRAQPGDDVISDMAQGQIDGAVIDEWTVTGMVTLLLSAGLDTVASMMGFIIAFLARNPGHRRRLIEHPEQIPDAVEELLRRFAIVVSARMVKQDFEYDGCRLKAGEMVTGPTPLHGLDDRRFDIAAQVNFDRKPRHATFGGGVHRCPGSTLARAELKIFLEEWLKRIPEFSIQEGSELTVEARGVATIVELPLVWPASAA